MKKENPKLNDFFVDRLTNSIVNTISGDSFQTEVSLLSHKELKQVQKNRGWLFNWKNELSVSDREVYKLTIINNTNIVQGLVSLAIKEDHIFIHLIENAPFNRGNEKLYEGVPGNLVAFACRLSFQRGSEGFVSFNAKTNLIEHYIKTLGAYHFGGHLMVIETNSANKLISKYFK